MYRKKIILSNLLEISLVFLEAFEEILIILPDIMDRGKIGEKRGGNCSRSRCYVCASRLP